MTKCKSFTVAASGAIAAVFLSLAMQPANAATINWSTAQNITGASDVVTTGTLFAAANFFQSGVSSSGTGNVTVNGVTFTGVSAPGSGTGVTSLNVANLALTGTSAQAGFLNIFGTSPLGEPAGYGGLLNKSGVHF